MGGAACRAALIWSMTGFSRSTPTTKFPKAASGWDGWHSGGDSSPGHHRRHPELHVAGSLTFGFENWRPVLYAVLLWCVALAYSLVMVRGEYGKKMLFILPAFLFTVFMVIFPTIFGLYIAFTDWNLSSSKASISTARTISCGCRATLFLERHPEHGLLCSGDPGRIRHRLRPRSSAERRNPGAQILPRRLPASLHAVAGGGLWMVGKSLGEYRFGPLATLARHLGWDQPAFSRRRHRPRVDHDHGRLDLYSFMLIMLLAGLQAMPKEVQEAARVDGATPWQAFWRITFPLMLPVSITAVILG